MRVKVWYEDGRKERYSLDDKHFDLFGEYLKKLEKVERIDVIPSRKRG